MLRWILQWPWLCLAGGYVAVAAQECPVAWTQWAWPSWVEPATARCWGWWPLWTWWRHKNPPPPRPLPPTLPSHKPPRTIPALTQWWTLSWPSVCARSAIPPGTRDSVPHSPASWNLCADTLTPASCSANRWWGAALRIWDQCTLLTWWRDCKSTFLLFCFCFDSSS